MPEQNPALDLDRLQALAEKATPGPWRLTHAGNMHYGVSHGEHDFPTVVHAYCGYDGYGNGSRKEDAEFIAAADPSTVLALIERVRQLEAAREWEYALFWRDDDSGGRLHEYSNPCPDPFDSETIASHARHFGAPIVQQRRPSTRPQPWESLPDAEESP